MDNVFSLNGMYWKLAGALRALVTLSVKISRLHEFWWPQVILLAFTRLVTWFLLKGTRTVRDTWHNWTRSLPMHDQFSGINTLLGLLEVTLVQALPLPFMLFLIITRMRNRWLIILNSMLLALRIGVLFGTARAYRWQPWSYWLSPCDLPVAIQLTRSALQGRHVWRGRVLVCGGM